jgi:hypothetical protein
MAELFLPQTLLQGALQVPDPSIEVSDRASSLTGGHPVRRQGDNHLAVFSSHLKSFLQKGEMAVVNWVEGAADCDFGGHTAAKEGRSV